jgi:hypothetical protein
MITLFSTPKPFRGHIDVIQRNALQSWKRLDPQVEVILVGDDEGAAEICREFDLDHVPVVRRSTSGAKYLKDVFRAVQERARHEHICYVNCDIILLPDFVAAARRVSAWRNDFLMVGQRTDVDITAPVNFGDPSWEAALRQMARVSGRQRDQYWIDYFLFHRRMYPEIPDLLIGRIAWDNWLVYKARSDSYPVVDATAVVLPIHQNHDYAYHPQGESGVFTDVEARENRRLAGGRDCQYRTSDANYRLTPSGIRFNVTVPHLKRVIDNNRRSVRRMFRVLRTDGLRAAASRF